MNTSRIQTLLATFIYNSILIILNSHPIINHFHTLINKLCNGPKVHGAMLVGPWFGPGYHVIVTC